MAAPAAPTTTTINWLSEPLDFTPAKAEPAKVVVTQSVTRPRDPKLALLLQRAKVPERSPTVYTVYPSTPDAVAEATARGKKKHLNVRERIAKKLRAGAPRASKTWHPEGLEHAIKLRFESVGRLLKGRPEPYYADEK
jgi:hypothetical protein